MAATMRCEICFEDLARFNPLTIRRPLTGDQFLPLGSNMPLPFPEPANMITWESMRCPYCHYRPIINEEMIYTSSGKHLPVKARPAATTEETAK